MQKVIGVALACVLGEACSPSGPPVRHLTIATGGTGGIYFPLGGTIARIYSENLPGINVSAQSTAGSLFNCGAVERGQADIAFTMADVAYQAYHHGTDVHPEPYQHLRAMVPFYDNVVQLVTYRESPIETVADLRGKRVGVGAPGSGTDFNAQRVLEAYGLSYADIQADYLSFSEIVQQLKNQTIDAGFVNASYPVSAIMDLDASVGAKLVPIDADKAEVIQGLDPNYFPTRIPGGTYRSMPDDLPTIGVSNLLVCHEGLEEDLVYELTKLLYQRQSELEATHQAAGRLSLARWRDVTIPLHPGAERFFREQEEDEAGSGSTERQP
ncbi:MAG TPA: TAXI family TRAP transporter solute-binding subunit [Vicinamibacteria bacterium]